MKKEKQNYKNREYKIISKLHLSGALPLFFIWVIPPQNISGLSTGPHLMSQK